MSGAVLQLAFPDRDHGWLLADMSIGMGHLVYTLWCSTDGGARWSRVTFDLESRRSPGAFRGCTCVGGLTFRSDGMGWAHRTAGAIMMAVEGHSDTHVVAGLLAPGIRGIARGGRRRTGHTLASVPAPDYAEEKCRSTVETTARRTQKTRTIACGVANPCALRCRQ